MNLVSRATKLLSSGRVMLALAVGAFVLAAVFLGLALHTPRYEIRVSAGDLRSRRADVARALADECARHDLIVELVDAPGSEEALAMLERGELDAALVQGGLVPGHATREVTPLGLEPLHLFVRGDLDVVDVTALRGLRVDLSPPGSGTRRLSTALLAHAGLEPGRDFQDEHRSYAELRELEREALPDAIFHVSGMPSPIADFLVHRRGYRLVALPYAVAISLRNPSVEPGTIPAGAYGAAPLTPPEDLPTLATRMMLVAREDLSADVVVRLLEAADGDGFVRAARIRRTERAALLEQPELALHAGTLAWLRRDDPLLTPELVEVLENARSFLVSLIVALVLLWRWYRSRRLHGLDEFLAQVSRIDREILDLEQRSQLELARLLAIRVRLGEVKARALEALTQGAIHSEELLASFLTHVSDVRSHLNAMILHERARLEKAARSGIRAEQARDAQAALEELWEDALADAHDDRELASRADSGARSAARPAATPAKRAAPQPLAKQEAAAKSDAPQQPAKQRVETPAKQRAEQTPARQRAEQAPAKQRAEQAPSDAARDDDEA